MLFIFFDQEPNVIFDIGGKRDEELILPVNSSLSVTLSQEQLCVTTSVAVSSTFSSDRIWLNGSENVIKDFPRLQKVLSLVREECRKVGKQELAGHKVHICSFNNFPTAAGLASSAAGFACLAFALTKLYKLDCDVSIIARQGSGSASRSVYGGFVKWEKGEMADGLDSIAVQTVSEKTGVLRNVLTYVSDRVPQERPILCPNVTPETHWPEMRVLVLVVSEEKKATSSTYGMQRSVETSELLKLRAEHVVPRRMAEMEDAILKNDFDKFADLTMKDSNQLHAICLDTYPPILPPYMNEVSHHIVRVVTEYNRLRGGTKVAYSFDAGPSAVLFLRENDVPECLDLLKTFFPPSEGDTNFVRGCGDRSYTSKETIKDQINLQTCPGGVKYIIHTKVGDGPRIIQDPARCLLDAQGLPKKK